MNNPVSITEGRAKALPNPKAEAALKVVFAIADAIRDAGEIPSGHLYAAVMGKMDLDAYERILALLKRNGLIEQDRSYLLRWIGPKRKEGGQ